MNCERCNNVLTKTYCEKCIVICSQCDKQITGKVIEALAFKRVNMWLHEDCYNFLTRNH